MVTSSRSYILYCRNPYDTALRLPRPLPLDHAADIHFNFSQPIGVGPLKHGLVPLSYLGAGGTSNPALFNRQHQPVAIVARLHTGCIAFRRFPWRPRNPFRPRAGAGSGIAGADDELSDDDTVASECSTSSDEDKACSDTDSACPSSESGALPLAERPRQARAAVAIASGCHTTQCTRLRAHFSPQHWHDFPRAAF